MTSYMARSLKKPRLLYQITIERSRYRKRALLLLLLVLISAGAWFALGLPQAAAADSRAVNIGRLTAAAIILLASIRLVINLVRWRSHRSETLRLFDRGFTWIRGGTEYQSSWSKVHTFREGGRGIYLGQRPLLQWGAHTLLMQDKQTFKLLPRHGNLRQLTRLLRPLIAEPTGIRMSRRLRRELPIRIHPKIVVWPGGLEIGKDEYPWETLRVGMTKQRLMIEARQNGKTRRVGRFGSHSIDNLGGFLEVAQTTIRTHRPARS
jgi:hypothetical protein